MKRDLYGRLKDWKAGVHRKPLVLRGARQTGKTYLLREFGRREYRRCHYLNFEEDRGLASLFEGSLSPDRLLRDLGLFLRSEIRPGEDLLVLDEIQACNQALAALKYFCEEVPEIHVASAGSLLGVRLSQPASFPVGKVDFLDLHPMTFYEFLNAVGEGRYREYLESLDAVKAIPQAFHDELTALLRRYYVVGGMPEAVARHVDDPIEGDFRTVQRAILDSYALDFAKHAPTSDIPKLSLVWESLPAQLARENKKFLFSVIRPGARAREYENAVTWLANAGLVHRSWLTATPKLPLRAYRELSSFKLYASDVGLLGALARVPVEVVVTEPSMLTEYHGAFVENFVAQHLAALGEDLHYWKNVGRASEVDFLLQHRNGIVPIEVKAGTNIRSKSLAFYAEKYRPPAAIRLTLQNLKQGRWATNVPLYAVQSLPRLLECLGNIAP